MGIMIANSMRNVLGLSAMELSAALAGFLIIIVLMLISFFYMNIRKRIDRDEKPSAVISGFHFWAIGLFLVGFAGVVLLMVYAVQIHNLFYGQS